jgi:C4-dicarboxylate-specific signal transduction histidine kinase
MTALLRELGSLARRHDAAAGRVSLPGVLDNIARLLRHDPRSRAVTVEVACASATPPIFAREDRLVQLFLNLGLNAIDAMPAGGLLRFEAEPDPGGAAVRIADSGAGIAEDARGRIFEPFFSTKGGGTGLGVFVCKGIVDELGGALELERTGPDGTVFRVALPLARAPGRVTEAG